MRLKEGTESKSVALLAKSDVRPTASAKVSAGGATSQASLPRARKERSPGLHSSIAGGLWDAVFLGLQPPTAPRPSPASSCRVLQEPPSCPEVFSRGEASRHPAPLLPRGQRGPLGPPAALGETGRRWFGWARRERSRGRNRGRDPHARPPPRNAVLPVTWELEARLDGGRRHEAGPGAGRS